MLKPSPRERAIAAEPSRGRATGVEVSPSSTATEVAGLFDRHGPRILAFCRSRLRSREEAEDAAQTTFLLAQRALARGVRPLAEATWLVTIAQNVCLNRYRDARRVREHELSREPQELERLAGAESPERVDVEALVRAVEHLPEPQRRAILLREWQGYSYAEIEQELGLGKAAVETLICRGRRALAAELGEEERPRRLRALDAASWLSGLKSLFGGGGVAAKLAATAVAVTAGAGVAIGTTTDGPSRPAPPSPARVAPGAPARQPVAAPRLVVQTAAAAKPGRRARPSASGSTAPAPAPATRARVAAPAAAPVAEAEPAGVLPQESAPPRVPGAAPTGRAPVPAPAPAASVQPPPVQLPLPPVVLPPVVPAAVETVEQTAAGVVVIVTEAVGTVTGAVGTVTGALPPVSAPPPVPPLPALPGIATPRLP